MPVKINELEDRGFWLLRSGQAQAELSPWLQQEFRLKLPTFGRMESAKKAMIWQPGPDAWMLMVSRQTEVQAPVIAIDLRAAYRVFELRGPQVRELINKGCPLDLGDGSFAPGSHAQSLFFEVPVQILRITVQQWLLQVPRSAADYLIYLCNAK